MRTAPVGYGDGSVYGDDESIGGGALSEIASISGVDTESVISTKSNGPGKPRRAENEEGKWQQRRRGVHHQHTCGAFLHWEYASPSIIGSATHPARAPQWRWLEAAGGGTRAR